MFRETESSKSKRIMRIWATQRLSVDSDFLLAHSVTQGRNDVQQIPVHRAGARLEGALRDPGVGVLADGDRLGRPCGRATRAGCPLIALDQAALVGEPPRGASLRCVGVGALCRARSGPASEAW
jgi:hypothetical protein